MNEQERDWAGPFGDAYTQRCRVEWQNRVAFWQRMLSLTQARSALEVGCNSGWNMRCLREADPSIAMVGADVNAAALTEARNEGLEVIAMTAGEVGDKFPDTFDLVFTAGVLIHIPPESLTAAMLSIVRASTKHVLCVEYESDAEEEVTYRGHANRLWRRPYGMLYERMGLSLVASGHAGPGFDDCHYTLLRKL